MLAAMPIYLLGFVDGELHATPLEDAVGVAPPGTPACEVPALVARIETEAAIAAAAAAPARRERRDIPAVSVMVFPGAEALCRASRPAA